MPYPIDEEAFEFFPFLKGDLRLLVHENHPLAKNKRVKEFRKLGAGRAVVTYAENLIKEQGVNFLWCKCRTTVREYSRRLGFEAHGEVFDYPAIGPHIVMCKKPA